MGISNFDLLQWILATYLHYSALMDSIWSPGTFALFLPSFIVDTSSYEIVYMVLSHSAALYKPDLLMPYEGF